MWVLVWSSQLAIEGCVECGCLKHPSGGRRLDDVPRRPRLAAIWRCASCWAVVLGARQLLTIKLFSLILQYLHGAELVRANLIQRDLDAQFECDHHIQRAPEDQALLRGLRGI